MQEELATTVSLALPIAVIAASLAGGLVLRLLLTRRLERLADRPGSATLRTLLGAARGSAALWCGTLGLYLATELTDLSPAVARVAPRLLLVMLVGSITWTIARAAADLVGTYAASGALPSATLVGNIVRLAVLGLGLLVLLQTLGLSITPILTALGVGGLAVALALQDTLSNLFAGIHILLSRQIRTGDYVRLETGQEGHVKDVTFRYTSIRLLSGSLLVVPNAKLATSVTTNFNRPDSRVSVPVSASVAYAEDLDEVERVTLEVATGVLHEVEGGVVDFAPVVRFHTFGDANVQFIVVVQARDFVSQGLLKHELVKRLHRRFREEGIEMPGGVRLAPVTVEAATSTVPARPVAH